MKGFDDGVTTFLGDSGFDSSIVCFSSSGLVSGSTVLPNRLGVLVTPSGLKREVG